MSAKENILNAVAKNQPKLISLPVIDLAAVVNYEDLHAQFRTVLEGIGGKVESVSDLATLKEQLKTDKESGSFVVNAIASLGEVDNQVASLSAIELEKLEKAYIEGTIGVAENGAIWVYESQMVNRLVPFICQHLILVIEKKNIVPTMHQAYGKIEAAREGFGAFIAGPSKTADIEQSLVIGAHGARSARIYIVG